MHRASQNKDLQLEKLRGMLYLNSTAVKEQTWCAKRVIDPFVNQSILFKLKKRSILAMGHNFELM